LPVTEEQTAGAGWRRWSQWSRLPLTPILLAMVVSSAGLYVYREHVRATAYVQQQATMYARVLADHTARAVFSVNVLMGAAASRLDVAISETARSGIPIEDSLQRTLSDVTAGLPLVRSLSVLRDDGWVQASSQAGNVGTRVMPELFLPGQQGRQKTLLFANGRDLADASPRGAQASKHQLLLLAGEIPAKTGRPRLWLVAALNPEYFATQHELLLDSQLWRSAVMSLDGRVLAATLNFPAEFGTVLPAASSAGAGEFGLMQHQGLDGQAALGAWRLTRDLPLRVQVELPLDEAMASWEEHARDVAAGTTAVSMMILVLGAAARRQGRARERAEEDRARARAQLREQSEMTEQVVHAMAVPVFLTDPQGKLLLANAAWSRLMGMDGDAATETEERERAARVQQLLCRGIDDVGTQDAVRWPLDLPDGGGQMRETVITKVALRGDAGQIRGIIGTAVDVTEYKQAARATESARRAAEASNQARAEFVANITHELRTPLQSILGFAELGESRAEGQDRLKLMFHRVHEAGGRMLRLVDELLDMSRIGSTVGSIRLRPALLAEPVREVLDELRPMAHRRGLRLQLQVDERLYEAQCHIDPARLQQVARNVLANALRFAPDHTAVEVNLSAVDGHAVVCVRDHGPGVPHGEVDSIFEPFVQSSLTKDGSGGTGLGLTICRQIMKAHGGFIEASNHSEGGAVFRFGVPLDDVVAAESPTANTPASTLAEAN
jgi:PAS domain S-box-containing protein